MKNTFKLLTLALVLTIGAQSNCMLRSMFQRMAQPVKAAAQSSITSFNSRLSSMSSNLANFRSTITSKLGNFSKAMPSNPFARFSSFVKPMAAQSSKLFAKPSVRFGALAGLSTITAAALMAKPAKAEEAVKLDAKSANVAAPVSVAPAVSAEPAQSADDKEMTDLLKTRSMLEELQFIELQNSIKKYSDQIISLDVEIREMNDKLTNIEGESGSYFKKYFLCMNNNKANLDRSGIRDEQMFQKCWDDGRIAGAFANSAIKLQEKLDLLKIRRKYAFACKNAEKAKLHKLLDDAARDFFEPSCTSDFE